MTNQNEIRQGPWLVYYDPPPIPSSACDWAWIHDGYDGPGDWRYGRAPSAEDAMAQIAEREADEADWREHLAEKAAATPQKTGRSVR